MSARLIYKLPGGHELQMEVASAKVKDVFGLLAEMAEVFGQRRCGHCQADLHDVGFPRLRQHKGFDFFELVCGACSWRCQFGQKKDDGSLYPKGWTEPFGKGPRDEYDQRRGPPPGDYSNDF